MRKAQLGGGVFVGCIMLGIGIGILYGHAGAGTLIGLGAGFILSAIATTIAR